MPVCALTMETFALGTMAPVASVMVPLNSAVAVCAAAGRVNERDSKSVAKDLRAFMALTYKQSRPGQNTGQASWESIILSTTGDNPPHDGPENSETVTDLSRANISEM